MKIKFQNEDKFYDLECKQIRYGIMELSGEDVPVNFSGFELWDEAGEIMLNMYYDFNYIWDQGDNYIQYTNKNIQYYEYITYNEEGYVTGNIVTTEEAGADERKVLRLTGSGKHMTEIPAMETLDEIGFFKYKIVDGEMVSVSEEEIEAYKAKLAAIEEQKRIEAEEAKVRAFAQLKEDKLKEISDACSLAIVSGVDYDDNHYSFDMADQNNILTAMQLAQDTGLSVSYHADGQPIGLYSPEMIMGIYVAQQRNVIKQTSYHNQLKMFVKTLNTEEEINNVFYGQELTGDYQTIYEGIMEQTDKVMNKFLGIEEIAEEPIVEDIENATEEEVIA